MISRDLVVRSLRAYRHHRSYPGREQPIEAALSIDAWLRGNLLDRQGWRVGLRGRQVLIRPGRKAPLVSLEELIAHDSRA
jgi:hypothetical protein